MAWQPCDIAIWSQVWLKFIVGGGCGIVVVVVAVVALWWHCGGIVVVAVLMCHFHLLHLVHCAADMEGFLLRESKPSQRKSQVTHLAW